jgi:ketosteroid isomerase-like protein
VSEENVEIVRAVYEALARHDAETPYRFYADDIEWEVGPRWASVGQAVVHGHEGVRRVWRDIVAVFGDFEVDAEDLIDAGDRVLAVVSERGSGRTSGAQAEHRHYAVWELRAGKITRIRVFQDRGEAERAAGLSPGA